MMTSNKASLLYSLLASSGGAWLGGVSGHGYLASPRSRNLRAYEETVWWPQTENDPEPESCPHCLNLGGSLARCGLVNGRNYDAPRNALGGDMPPSVQAAYAMGQEITVDVSLTAVHGGHFVFSGCPISPGEIPSQDCFDANRLTFVEDLLHGARYDPNHPERAYVPPNGDPNHVPDYTSSAAVMSLSFKMRLPPDLYGDLVLIQWYYLTANSCHHQGYQSYEWPDGWPAPSTMACGEISPDGTGVPEQFWNCAEVEISQEPNTVPSPNPPADAPTPAETSSGIVDVPAPADASTELFTSASIPSQSEGNNTPSAGSHGKTIVGYYASWQWYDRNNKAAPESMDFTKVQRVNFAFFQTDTQGAIWGTDSWADPIVLFGPYNWNPSEGSMERCSWDGPSNKACNHHDYEKGLIYLVKAAGAEIYPSLGGWTLSDAFPKMAADATARATFAQNCVDLIVEYDFDGIDIDWEYPGYVDHSGTPQDKDNFKLLLNDVRAKLDELGAQTGKFYGLTAALPCGPTHIANMDIAHVSSTLSQLNLMTYDFHGSFSATTGTNAPLYDQGWGEADFDVHNCVQNWIEGGGSRDKINIGLPFYGRSFATATGLNQQHSGADQLAWGIDDGTPQYFNIIAKLPSMTSVWDKKTWTQYAYFEDGGLVSFDNENAICAKVQYAIKNNLAGFIIWELTGDLMDDLSTPLLDMTNKKLQNPDLSCGEPGIYPEEGGDIQVDQGVPPTPATYESSPGNPEPSAIGQPATSTDLLAIDQPATSTAPSVIGQPVTSSEVSAVGRPSTVFLCGTQQTTFNIADSKSLDLSFWYELHGGASVPKSDVLTEVKSAMLTSIANQLRCTGSSSMLRSFSSKSLLLSREYVKGLESAPTDLHQNVPCSINISPMEVPTICYSMMGRLTVRVKSETSDAVLKEIRDELLFAIRMDMVLGAYESANVKKVIFGDFLESKITVPNSLTASQPQSEGGTTTMIIAILFSVFVIVLLGVLLFAVRKRRRPQTRCNSEEVHTLESTEKTWRMALESWRKTQNSLETYDDNPNHLAVDSYEIRYHDRTGDQPQTIEVEPAFHGNPNQHVEEGQETKKIGRFTRFMRSRKDQKKAELHASDIQRGSEMNISNDLGANSEEESKDSIDDIDESEGQRQSFGKDIEGKDESDGKDRSFDIAIGNEGSTDVEDEEERNDSLGMIPARRQSDEQDFP